MLEGPPVRGAVRRRRRGAITWECKFDGSIARLVDGNEPEQKKAKPPRTHWDMLLERRSISELEDILNERLQEVRARRGR